MWLYRAYSLTVESELQFPELATTTGVPEVAIRLSASPPLDAPAWFHHWGESDEESPKISAAFDGDDYLVRVPGVADFRVRRDGSSISLLSTTVSGSMDLVRHEILNQLLPMTLSARGDLTLHASGVVTRLGAVAFLGDSGFGKSSLAVELAQHGCPMLADDCIRVVEHDGTLLACAGYAGARLWPDSASLLLRGRVAADDEDWTRKELVSETSGVGFAHVPAPLRVLYVLAPPEEMERTSTPASERVSPGKAMIELVKHAHRIHVKEPDKLTHEFDRLSSLVLRIPCRSLRFPRRVPIAGDVQRLILDDITHFAPRVARGG